MANRFFLFTATCIAAAMLAGCSDQGTITAEQSARESGGVTGAGAAEATGSSAEKTGGMAMSKAGKAAISAGAAAGRNVEQETDSYFFSYSYPAEAASIPALKAWFDTERKRTKTQLLKDVKEAEADAKAGDYEYRAYSLGNAWKRVADTPRFLSLSREITTYMGGAHGNQGFGSLLWDKKDGRRLEVLDIFASKAAFTAAISKPFCNGLNRQRAKKRGVKYNKSSIDEFDKCIDPAASTVILGSSDKKRFDKIGILIAPYEAGPYAEGSYEVTLPVTAAVLKAVKPQYRDAFRAK